MGDYHARERDVECVALEALQQRLAADMMARKLPPCRSPPPPPPPPAHTHPTIRLCFSSRVGPLILCWSLRPGRGQGRCRAQRHILAPASFPLEPTVTFWTPFVFSMVAFSARLRGCRAQVCISIIL